MAITDLRSLFEHHLQELYYMELKLIDTLSELASKTGHAEASDAFSAHRRETEGQARRLEQVFEMAGFQVLTQASEGFEGLENERQRFSEEEPSPAIRDLFHVGVGEKVERYEIGGYEGLIELAQQLKLGEAADLLRQSLREEEAALHKLRELSARLVKEAAT